MLPVLMMCLLITACGPVSQYQVKNNFSEQDIFQDGLFGPPASILSMDEVFALTEDQKQDFLKHFHSKEYRDLSDSQRIFKYLKNKLEYFNFHSETLIATDAMALNSGNCMSLAILTRALSKLTHVGISYELARTPPVFQREGNLELNSQHIRTVIFNKTTKTTKQFVRPNDKVKIDYFSTAGSRTLRSVKKEEFHSLFYSNRAAEAMIRNESNRAYWLIKEALKIKPDNLIAINMLGVLYHRIGEEVYAENTYRYGLSHGGDQLELLNNYHKFLLQAGRNEEALIIAQTLENYDDPDPFKWIDLADAEFREGNYHNAIKFYEKAQELASYLHQPYAGIAKANFQLGRNNRAIKAMQMAIENSHRFQTTSIYQAKYDYMKSLQNTN
ncbi:Tfp pilus assembly protein PilF [Marinicella litoralis]|uniref:Tfp pilus assembly protein PilF n=2 Tax=Marinicella litoralis TaxID=644220 RepID=A0A4R6XJT9_9GAMM|nr:Tfp pilus assembly protein PilF [Marinicella litoralis]